MTSFVRFRRGIAVATLMAIAIATAACGGDSDSGVRLISPDNAAEVLENPPADLVVLDVRTPEEFVSGRLDDAIMIDYYDPGFADQIAQLDRDVPYLLYCRSGNRSGDTRKLMEDLGFSDVSDIDGGMNAWLSEGLPFISG